jgi:hypothetical protein
MESTKAYRASRVAVGTATAGRRRVALGDFTRRNGSKTRGSIPFGVVLGPVRLRAFFLCQRCALHSKKGAGGKPLWLPFYIHASNITVFHSCNRLRELRPCCCWPNHT